MDPVGPIEIRPQPGPQEAFLSSSADIAIYGGAAGGGKSFALILESLRHINVPGFGGIIFRRTSPELTGAGSLWELASAIMRPLGAKLRESPTLDVRWPSGATLQMMHLQHASDVYAHQSKQYAFIGFDELTHFESSQFWYMVSRLRSTCGVRPYLRACTNPDPDSFVRQLIAWWIGPDGRAIPERSGVLRWFVRKGETLVWGDTPEDLAGMCEDGDRPMSLTFIHAGLEDNAILLAKDPGYRARLKALPEVERERLLGANWDIRPEGGKYIQASYLERRWTVKPEHLNIYIASDYAVSEPAPGRDPDSTEHAVFGLTAQDDLYVIDWWHGQTSSDVWIDRLLDLITRHKPACVFGEGGTIRRAIEPFLLKRMRERKVYARLEWLSTSVGQAGSSKQGYEDSSKRAKAIRGRAFQARAAMGKVVFPEDSHAPWVRRVIDQCVGFPMGHDDAFDALSHMCQAIDQTHPAIIPASATPAPRRDYGHGETREDCDWTTV